MNSLGPCCVFVFGLPVFFFAWMLVGSLIKPRRMGLYLAASVPVFVVLFFGIFLFFGRHQVTHRPMIADVVGYYTLTTQRVGSSGFSVPEGEASDIELREDGTFSAKNIPRHDLHGPNVLDRRPWTGSGHWRIEKYDFWGVRLDSETDWINSIPLDGWRPPYRLWIWLGDPDAGEMMIFDKEADVDETP